MSFLENYKQFCSLGEGLLVEEEKFCYDSQSFLEEINRLVKLGANSERICRRIHSINPDFCASMQYKRSSLTSTASIDTHGPLSTSQRTTKRGVIYE